MWGRDYSVPPSFSILCKALIKLFLILLLKYIALAHSGSYDSAMVFRCASSKLEVVRFFLHVRASVVLTKMLTRFQAKMWDKTKLWLLCDYTDPSSDNKFISGLKVVYRHWELYFTYSICAKVKQKFKINFSHGWDITLNISICTVDNIS